MSALAIAAALRAAIAAVANAVACAVVFCALLTAVATANAIAPTASTARTSSAQTPPPQHSPTAVVQQPRSTGYFVGDILTQRILLALGAKPVSPLTLPAPGRVSAWFERRSATIETDAAAHRWLIVQYQILNAPPKLVTVTLPAWTLTSGGANTQADPATARADSDHHARWALHVPATSINIAPLSPPGSPTQVGAADLRPDRLPPEIATAALRRDIELSAGGLGLTLIAWISWIAWRNRRAITTQPFASALRELRALDDREPRAWQALHRAFDRTAGRVVQRATLPTLFDRAPHLTPLRTQIEHFFAQSSEMFFAPRGGGGAASSATSAATIVPIAPPPHAAASTIPTLILPRELCAELRRIERRNER